jgi:hypothetical protein
MDGAKRGGSSGKKLATAIVLIGVAAGVAALFFREFTPKNAPATQPAVTTQSTRLTTK